MAWKISILGKGGGLRHCLEMILEKFPAIQQLSASEKLLFVTELWNELEANPTEIPVDSEIVAELDRRMEDYRKNPNQFTTWDACRSRILDARKSR